MKSPQHPGATTGVQLPAFRSSQQPFTTTSRHSFLHTIVLSIVDQYHTIATPGTTSYKDRQRLHDRRSSFVTVSPAVHVPLGSPQTHTIQPYLVVKGYRLHHNGETTHGCLGRCCGRRGHGHARAPTHPWLPILAEQEGQEGR